MIDKKEIRKFIKEAVQEIFFSEEEYSPFNNLQDKINKLLNVQKYEERLERSIQISDKFQDYMKNIDKLNSMINEFKGLVSIVRGEANKLREENDNSTK